MATLKETAIDAIQKLPESADFDDIMYQLYVLQKIEKGREAARQGNTLTVEELKKEMQTW